MFSFNPDRSQYPADGPRRQTRGRPRDRQVPQALARPQPPRHHRQHGAGSHPQRRRGGRGQDPRGLPAPRLREADGAAHLHPGLPDRLPGLRARARFQRVLLRRRGRGARRHRGAGGGQLDPHPDPRDGPVQLLHDGDGRHRRRARHGRARPVDDLCARPHARPVRGTHRRADLPHVHPARRRARPPARGLRRAGWRKPCRPPRNTSPISTG